MTDRAKDDLRSARVAAEGANKAEKAGDWTMAQALWRSAADRYAACGMPQVAEVALQKMADAGKRA